MYLLSEKKMGGTYLKRKKVSLEQRILLFEVLLFCFAGVSSARTDRPFEIVAHRGVKKLAPENSC